MDFNFEDDEEQMEVRPAGSGTKKRFRKNKLKLVFDPEERKKFLQGFRKRKQERKEQYIEKLERNLAKEKKKIKQQTQRAVQKLSSSHTILPEVKNLIENLPEKEETYDLGNTLVSITSLDDQVYRNLPTIKEEDEDDIESEEEQKFNSKRLSKSNFHLTDDEDEGEGEDELKKVAKSDPFFNPINDDELSGSDASSEDERQVHYNPLEMLRRNTESAEPSPDQKGMTKAKLEKEANRLLQQSEAFKKMQKIKQKKSKKFRMFRLQPTSEDKDGGRTEGASAGSKGGRGKKFKKLLKSKKKGKRK